MVHPLTFPEILPDPPIASMNCPRCDRRYDSGKNVSATLEILKKHVTEQHPDHDPEWAD